MQTWHTSIAVIKVCDTVSLTCTVAVFGKKSYWIDEPNDK